MFTWNISFKLSSLRDGKFACRLNMSFRLSSFKAGKFLCSSCNSRRLLRSGGMDIVSALVDGRGWVGGVSVMVEVG